jgi:DNA-directed RNA polymerase subunit F
MIGKEIKTEKSVTVSEVRDILEKRKEKGELTYEQKVSLEYAAEFGKNSLKKSRDAVEALKDMGIDEKLAVKLVDVAPKTKEEVKLIFEKVRFDLKEANVQKILDIVAELR